MTETTENIRLAKESEDEFYSVHTVNENLDKIDEAFGKKVDKKEGKELSSNDYTDEDKEKLDGIEAGAQANRVRGVKGSAQETYQEGLVNLTKEDIGLAQVNNTADKDKHVSQAVRLGMPRIAENPSDLSDLSKYPNGSFTVKEFAPTEEDIPELPSGNYYHIYTGQSADPNYASQLAVGMTAGDLAYRYKRAGVWSSWVHLIRGDTIGNQSVHDAGFLRSVMSDTVTDYGTSYQVRSIFNNVEQRFYLDCVNNNSDANHYPMAVEYAQGAGSAVSATDAENAVNIIGVYTGSGGAQPPSSIPNGKVRFYMMNAFKGTSGLSGYADCMLMDTYTGADVPYVTGFAIMKNVGVPRAFLAVGQKGDTTKWLSQTELITTGNIGSQSVAAATKAAQDGNGNVIANTYAKKGIYGDGGIFFSHEFTIGANSKASGSYICLAIGDGAEVNGDRGAYAIGEGPKCSGSYGSHAVGHITECTGQYGACSEGSHTIVGNQSAFACGKYNKELVNGGGPSNTVGTAFVIGNGTGETARSNAFSVMFNGVVKAKSTITASTTADYAEFFEWKDGNPDGEDRVGKFVTLNGDKISIAESEEDYILGIVSGEPFVLGNGDCDTWNGMYLRDEFGRTVYEPAPKMEMEEITEEVEREVEEIDEETGEVRRRKMMETISAGCREKEVFDEDGNPVYEGTRPVLNPEYDPNQPYISRFDRKEWSPVGMLGVLSVYDDGSCEVNGYCKCGKGGIATKSETGYRVIKRVADHIIRVILR